jgi:hypothetical protein
MSETVKTPDTPAEAGTGPLTMAEAVATLLKERSDPAPATSPPAAKTPSASGTPQTPADEPEDEDAGEQTIDTPDAGTEPDAPVEEPAPDEEADEPEGAAQEPEDQEYEVQVQGKPQRVTLKELVNSYHRQADYSRKMADLAATRKSHDGEVADLRTERAQYAELLVSLRRQINTFGGTEPNWNALKQQDPIGYLEAKEAWRDQQAKLDAIKVEEDRLAREAQKDQNARLQELRGQVVNTLMEKLPSWRDERTRKSEIRELVEFAETYGYSAEELGNAPIVDPRFIFLVRDLMVARKGKGAGPIAAKRVSPVLVKSISRGRSVPNTDPNTGRRSAAQAKFNEKPSIANAVDALLAERGIR